VGISSRKLAFHISRHQKVSKTRFKKPAFEGTQPIPSMYGILTYIYPQKYPNLGKYTYMDGMG